MQARRRESLKARLAAASQPLGLAMFRLAMFRLAKFREEMTT
jgi:hypothetical protein